MPSSSLSPESNRPDIEHGGPLSSNNNNNQHTTDRTSRTFALTLVATPIGNLSDFSPRAIQALKHADLVLCEDTRTTARLLSEYNISVRTEALHEHNEEQRVPGLISKLEQGLQIALVSDAGMPLLSDPGYRLVRAAIDADIPLTVIPGPNAALTGLVLSGLPPHPFMFIGFPPPRSSARKEAFAKLHAAEHAGLAATLIWHESPHRLSETLVDMEAIFGPSRQGAVARELTKRFEEVRRGTLSQLAEYYAANTPRGEITVLLGPPSETHETSQRSLDDTLRSLLETHSVKDAATLAATAAGLPRRTVYARALELTTKGKN
ncbi:16S rRNA (cytidine(1402)-2'-O)-methyltransferase [Acetobacter thailandicus]|uniref:16S rRNA (cytidine(1402)-2'-O)-methyltransferase n=1 Tax=Acetobacter thailandicus TaxID=1502842 RepID=UPI001BAC7C01|nr:16S rRNA (cytidine(1402)-2'-O)-methyltransferase [Acetobacter thailandicus]